jgi:hypothetical protein
MLTILYQLLFTEKLVVMLFKLTVFMLQLLQSLAYLLFSVELVVVIFEGELKSLNRFLQRGILCLLLV